MSNTTRHGWQYERSMTPAQFTEILRELGLSQAACARYLGLSLATVARYKRGAIGVPTGYALLLRAVRDMGVQLVVPPRKAEG